MNIVIIGLGTIGRTILGSLASDKHTITIIDENSDKIEKLVEKYDVFGVAGNGACMDIQQEAHVKDADLVISLTRGDEVNILACMVAKKLGAKNTIARVRNPDYGNQMVAMQEDLGLSLIVNPEREAAAEIINRINLSSVGQVEHFAKGRALLVEVLAEPGCALVGESLMSLSKKLNYCILICAVQRGDDVIIPSGQFVIQEGDRLHITSSANFLGKFLAEMRLIKSPIKNIMIIGGSRTAYYLASGLSKKRYNIKLIEKNRENADTMAELLPYVTVIKGDGTNHDLLLEEGIESMDAFVALTGIDEENMIVSMFANSLNVNKTITRIKNQDLYGMLGSLGIKNAVSPNFVVADRIISYIRALDNSRGSNVLNLYRLVNNRVEALEFSAKKQEKFFHTPLKDLKLKKDCLIACIIRKNDVIIPDGNSTIHLGDNVIVVTTHKNFTDLIDIFE